MPSKDDHDFLLPVPPNPADEPPQSAIIFNLDWLPVVLYGLAELRDIDIWDSPPEDTLARIDDLISKFVDPVEDILTMIFPKHATLWHDEAKVITGNTLLINQIANTQAYNQFAYQNTANNGDSFQQDIFLEAGEYTLSVLGVSTSTSGSLEWWVDDAIEIAGQNWYSATFQSNVIKTDTITVPTSGHHKLIGLVNGKQGSDYFIILTKYWLSKNT